MDTGVGIVLLAGTLTFGNEWLQAGKLNWRVPIATVLLAGLDGLLSDASPKAGISFAAIILIGAATTSLNGKSPIDEFNSVFEGGTTTKGKK